MTESRRKVTVPSTVTTGNVEDVADGSESTLAERIDEVCALRNFSPREWCLRAKLSESYLAAYRNRAKSGAIQRLPEVGAEKLAKVAEVSPEWLRFGRGPRDLTAVPTVAPAPAPSSRQALIDSLARSASELSLAGDVEGARIAAESLVRLLGGAPSRPLASDEEALEHESHQRRRFEPVPPKTGT